jgi:hypothetical protein
MEFVRRVTCKISTSFGDKKDMDDVQVMKITGGESVVTSDNESENTIDKGKVDMRVIKIAGGESTIKMGNLTTHTEFFYCNTKQAILDHYKDFCGGQLILLPKIYSSEELYQMVVENIIYYQNSVWKVSKYSCCIRIAEVVSDGKKKYPLVVGKEDCKECNINASLVKSIMVALNCTTYNSESYEEFTVYGILIRNDGKMKTYKTTNVKKGRTPIIIYPLKGLDLKENSLEVCEIVEYIFKYTLELFTNPD